MSGRKRRSFEPGHRPKFVVVADETEECDRAVYFAARRSSRIGGGIVLVHVIEPTDFQHWLGVGEVMKQEAEEAAGALLERLAARARAIGGIQPERVIRTGARSDEIQAVIDADEDISFLVLAAGTGSEGPGPLVSDLVAQGAGAFPIPIVIVPGGLAETELDALT